MLKRIFIAVLAFLTLSLTSNTSVFADSNSRAAVFGVATFSPDYSELNVPLEQTIQINFTRAIKLGEGKIVLQDGYGKNVEFDISTQGNSLLIKPKGKFRYNTVYSIAIEKNAVLNAEADTNIELENKFVYSFTTLSPKVEQEIKKATVQPLLPSTQTQVTSTQPTLQTQQTHEIILIEKGKPISYKINGQPSNYSVWVSDPKVAHVQVQNGHLVINGIGEGSIQVAIRNTVSQKKVVLNVKVVNSVLNL